MDDFSQMKFNSRANPGRNSSSASAAEHVNNDRHAHISFTNDLGNGCCFGCGYGALNTEIEPYVSANPNAGASNDDGVTLTIHGFLGTFHSVLYQSPQCHGSEDRLSVISIAPHSFSVGMFSWFPLVSSYSSADER